MSATIDALQAHQILLDDVRLMLNHALTTGRPVPPAWLELMASIDGDPEPAAIRRLAHCHEGLSLLVAPATPRSLRYLEGVGTGKHTVPVMKHLGIAAILLLVAFVGLATRPEIGLSSADFHDGVGMGLLVNLLFQLCAAGLGATFVGLFKGNRHVDDFSFDPRYEFSYWVRVMLGLVSGLVLAQLVPVGDGKTFGRPLLALLGGFSADVVYQTLHRLVMLASSLVESPPQAQDIAASERSRADVREAQLKVGIAGQLTALRGSVDGEAGAAVDAMIAELAPSDATPASSRTVAQITLPDDAVPEQAAPEEAPVTVA